MPGYCILSIWTYSGDIALGIFGLARCDGHDLGSDVVGSCHNKDLSKAIDSVLDRPWDIEIYQFRFGGNTSLQNGIP